VGQPGTWGGNIWKEKPPSCLFPGKMVVISAVIRLFQGHVRFNPMEVEPTVQDRSRFTLPEDFHSGDSAPLGRERHVVAHSNPFANVVSPASHRIDFG